MQRIATLVGINKIAILKALDSNASNGIGTRVLLHEGTESSQDYFATSDLKGFDFTSGVDLVTISDFRHEKQLIQNNCKNGLGIEMLVSDGRKLDGSSLAKWFNQLSEVHRFCIEKDCQFILSSGATKPSELVSGQSLDSILQTARINPASHWQSCIEWLHAVIARRFSTPIA